MAKVNQDLNARLDRIEMKVDKVTTEVVPALLVEIAKITTKSKTESKMYSKIYGGIALVVSITSLAVAYFKN